MSGESGDSSPPLAGRGGGGGGAASGVPHALAAGSLAALASVFAKLTVDDRTRALAAGAFRAVGAGGGGGGGAGGEVAGGRRAAGGAPPQEAAVALVRAACFAAIFACNAAMWTSFTRALNRSPSSARVTVINTAANFCVTALLGNWLFDEPLALQWYFGASLIVAGSLLVSKAAGAEKPKAG